MQYFILFLFFIQIIKSLICYGKEIYDSKLKISNLTQTTLLQNVSNAT